jgi:hypothetical protein
MVATAASRRWLETANGSRAAATAARAIN